ncbi:MAG TPA: DUF4476 domain-containing protein [Chitinophagaceae bacterium]
MKKIFSILVACFISVLAVAQYASTVTINVKGTRNKEIWVDGQNYTASNINTTGNAVITLSDLSMGQHTLQLVRSNVNNSSTTKSNSNFYLRDGYDMQVTIANNGSIQLKEIRQKVTASTYRTPMNAEDFTTLYNNIRNEYRTNIRLSEVNKAFTTGGNYFTTAQARQLIQTINSQVNRLQLAKSSYAVITDPGNFSQLYDLLATQARKNELAVYVKNYIAANPDYNNNAALSIHNQYRTAMSTTDFSNLYQAALNKSPESIQINYIASAFANANYYYTTSQAKQLIQLIDNEADRLTLAKTAFRGITDAVNFSQLYDLFSWQASRNELMAYVNAYNYNNSNTAGTIYKTPMSATSFNAIYSDVQKQWGLGAKMNKLVDIFNNTGYYFTTTQAKQLIQLVSAESNRLQLAKASYVRITDPANFTLLFDVLASQSSRDELTAYVNANYYNSSTSSNSGYMTPMSTENFNNLYSQVQNQWGLGVKMQSLTEIFANTSYYFTAAQAKQLIQLVSAESNRLQLAKASYDRITDRTNFASLYDLLASQASRDELQAYVKTRF